MVGEEEAEVRAGRIELKTLLWDLLSLRISRERCKLVAEKGFKA